MDFSEISDFNITCVDLDCPSKFANKIDNSLSCMHLNVRSLKNRQHFVELSSIVELVNKKQKIDIIVITEAWLNDINDMTYLQIPGYQSECYIREGHGGGIVIYINDEITYNLITDYNIMMSNAESLWLNVCNKNKTQVNTKIGAIYRPPSKNINNFIDELDLIMSKIADENKKCVILGDMNINTLNESCSCRYVDMHLINFIKSFVKKVIS